MSFMEELRAKRQKFRDGVEANQGDINLDIFEDFYPDKAHFVFELLQNAEDTEATECTFTLTDDSLQFRHNGKRQFSENDISSITGINNSTKTKLSEAIGKFGVGFKSVFIYTLTPEIHSGEYSFSINNLVMPELIERIPDLGQDTVFCFPFNNHQKKTARESYIEIRDGLKNLSDLTLLFLKRIKSIAWIIKKQETGRLLEDGRLFRVQHTEYHIEVIKEIYATHISSSDYLRFSQAARGHDNQHICIAFPLTRRNDQGLLEKDRPFHENFKITAAMPGRVSVFFPAEKESSGLRFHIHGPFIPTLDRSSVKDTMTNNPLFAQIAIFAAECLHRIRDLNLLSPGFLGILPNPQDALSLRYEPIREAIVSEMNTRNLTPTQAGGHAPANRLLQAKANLKELLDVNDLKLILPPSMGFLKEWAIAATQKNSNVDRFLSSLAILNWGTEEFVTWLKNQFNTTDLYFHLNKKGHFDDWLKAKSIDWMQKLYALLFKECLSARRHLDLRKARLVRLTDGDLSAGSDCFIVDENHLSHSLTKWVPKELFSSGTSFIEQKEAYSFLEELGVRKVGDRERVEMILKNRYKDSRFCARLDDIRVFMEHYKQMPKDADLFSGERIFLCENGLWQPASNIYIDEPFFATGLKRFYELRGKKPKIALSPKYLELDIDKKEFLRFAEALGAIRNLEIQKIPCHQNPMWDYLKDVPGQNMTTPLDEDYMIYGFEMVFENCDIELATLIWDTLSETKELAKYLVASYRKNMKGGIRQAPSQLVCQLLRTAWVPQRGINPVKPPFADHFLLPDGFPFDPKAAWVEAIDFGSGLTNRIDEKAKVDSILKEGLGIKDEQSLEDIRRFVQIYSKLTPEQRRDCLESAEKRIAPELPENESRNPDLRRDRVGDEAMNARERITETRDRAVSVGREAVKEETAQYLKEQYTNPDGEMICQICQRVVPFKRLDGRYYFEAVEFLEDLKRRHPQNYLALCPNHAAMFKHANQSKGELVDEFSAVGNSSKLAVQLADARHTIYFTKNHLLDLRAVIGVDQNS
jgi:hypothetical protein